MNRRSVIKTLAISTGGLITLPFWMVSCGITEKKTHLSSFTLAEQDTLAKMVDTIIPAGNSIGAISVGVDKFLQQLFDDCYEEPVQGNIKQQLKELQHITSRPKGKSFTDANQKEREQILIMLSTSGDKNVKDFYAVVKSETIRGFITSQKVMTEFHGYKVAPGHYFGSVTIKA
jgi:hypothetical protein